MAHEPLKPGDTLWLVRRWSTTDKGRVVTIRSVARKYATATDGTRIDKHTLAVPDSDAQCFRSEADHKTAVAADKMWILLNRRMHMRPPEVDTQRIRQAAVLLGVEIDAAP